MSLWYWGWGGTVCTCTCIWAYCFIFRLIFSWSKQGLKVWWCLMMKGRMKWYIIIFISKVRNIPMQNTYLWLIVKREATCSLHSADFFFLQRFSASMCVLYLNIFPSIGTICWMLLSPICSWHSVAFPPKSLQHMLPGVLHLSKHNLSSR